MELTWRWQEVEFTSAGTIDVHKDGSGAVTVHAPQQRYAKRDTVPLNRYGEGPFCRFRVHGLPHSSGVYVYMVDDSPVYIVETHDLYGRFYAYGNISPKNCYRGGRETNCRMNTAIHDLYSTGKRINLFIHETTDYKQLELRMIAALQPKWNRRGIANLKGL